MDSKAMTRKEFVTLTFTLIGGAATASACSSSSNGTGTGGTNGATGGVSGGGGVNGHVCSDPLPDSMVPDDTMHMHTLTIPLSTLSATTDQTLTTGPVIDASGTIAAHTHMVTLTSAHFTSLKGGVSVTVPTQVADGHMHMYMVSCTSGTTGTGGAGGNGTAGHNGTAGANGTAGTNGSAGASGAAGASGTAGSNGNGGAGGH
jgi:hypothetical protein